MQQQQQQQEKYTANKLFIAFLFMHSSCIPPLVFGGLCVCVFRKKGPLKPTTSIQFTFILICHVLPFIRRLFALSLLHIHKHTHIHVFYCLSFFNKYILIDLLYKRENFKSEEQTRRKRIYKIKV